MWMTDYIRAIKRGLRDQHGMEPSGGTEKDPLFDNVPDGTYPIVIDGETDYVRMDDGKIYCCNFSEPERT
jgi:hypothetical protein